MRDAGSGTRVSKTETRARPNDMCTPQETSRADLGAESDTDLSAERRGSWIRQRLTYCPSDGESIDSHNRALNKHSVFPGDEGRDTLVSTLVPNPGSSSSTQENLPSGHFRAAG